MSEHLYIHVPFCLKKCRYCDFYSETNLSRLETYVSALVREIELRTAQTVCGDKVSVKTVYFGGGTPSVLPAAFLERILETIARHYSFASALEITLEANPGTLDREYLTTLRRLGINRLSLGVQSFEDDRLALLGRIHTGKEAVQAIDGARAAGFDNLGLDLIYGLPGETRKDWQGEMDQALCFAPEHLSCYMLTLESGTPLYNACQSGQFIPMAGSSQVDLFSFTSVYLSDAGYHHYEISNFAREKTLTSRHNSAYWKMVPYTGFGPSAHSYQVQNRKTIGKDHVRSWNVANLNQYIVLLSRKCLPLGDREHLTPEQQMLERILVGLRTARGIDIPAFNTLPGASFQRDCNSLAGTLVQDGLGRFVRSTDAFCLTREGWARLDSIVEAFASHLS